MGAAPKVELLASHWLSLRETPLRILAHGRAQAREAWRVAAVEYERCTQSERADADDHDAAAKAPSHVRGQHPG
ncbi:MAG: hypothetical protein ACREPE_07100 [Lysobacter sp.]